MDRKKLVLLVCALVVAIGTAFVARSMFAGAGAPQAEAAAPVPQGPRVLVAQRALPVGTIITADSLAFQPWPGNMVKDAYFLEGEADMNKLLGTVVRFPITAGEPVTQGALVAPGDRGFLAAALTPGMRAITVPVSAESGVAGFIFPGDRVDMVLTQSISGDGQALKASETILANLRVLATDQATTQETVDGKTVPKQSRTVTLEVTPRIAEKVAVAQTMGTISLTLRPLGEGHADLEKALADGSVSIPDNATPAQEAKLMRMAESKPEDGKTTYVTGGDVSRFSRSTLPPTGNSGPANATASGPVQQVYRGPVVRVTRGKDTTAEPISGLGKAPIASSTSIGRTGSKLQQTMGVY